MTDEANVQTVSDEEPAEDFEDPALDKWCDSEEKKKQLEQLPIGFWSVWKESLFVSQMNRKPRLQYMQITWKMRNYLVMM